MPMPNPRIEMYEDWHERAFRERAKWQVRYLWWPKRCSLSGQRLWFCRAYKGVAMWTGPDEPVYETKYHGSAEHLIWLLKGNT